MYAKVTGDRDVPLQSFPCRRWFWILLGGGGWEDWLKWNTFVSFNTAVAAALPLVQKCLREGLQGDPDDYAA